MRILGVDPGLRVTGYGVIEVPDIPGDGAQLELLEAGIVRTKTGDPIAIRLREIHDALSAVIVEFKPQALVLEKLYSHYSHVATAILMGHARGVICLLAGIHGVPLVNIASTHAKKAVTGHGHAGKAQIQRMVQHALGLRRPLEPPDVADALAVAIAYVSHLRKK